MVAVVAPPPGDDDNEAASPPRRSLPVLIVAGAAMILLLIGLGTWQIHRRAWKVDLIAHVDARVHAAPVPAPPPAQWPQIGPADAYRHVSARGRFLNDRETYVEAVTALGGGSWVVTPFRTDDGFTVLVNRGFVTPEQRDPGTRAAGQIGSETRVTGLLRLTEPGGAFLRTNDSAADRWFSRDVAAIAAARGVEPVAPYFIDADATPNPGGAPVGGLTVVSFPNNHLVYALTWYGLAVMIAVLLYQAVRHETRRRDAPAEAEESA